MHALNNYLGGPYITRDACVRAARQVVFDLSQVGGGDVEDQGNHLHPVTGWLSVQVINVLGASLLGVHVEERATTWEELRRAAPCAALVNWNNSHWTVLRSNGVESWTHI